MLRRIAVVLILAGFVGCGGGDDTPSVNDRPRSTATVEIVSPTEGETVTSPVEVKVNLEGGRIVAEASKTLTPDTGHLHVLVDGELISQTFALTETIESDPGSHLLTVEFVAADHSPFNPRVIATATFDVK